MLPWRLQEFQMHDSGPKQPRVEPIRVSLRENMAPRKQMKTGVLGHLETIKINMLISTTEVRKVEPCANFTIPDFGFVA